MNKEIRNFLIRFTIKDQTGKIWQLEKKEAFEIEHGKNAKKLITFEVNGEKYKFIFGISKVTKGWFGDGGISYGIDGIELAPGQKPPEVISKIEMKDTKWRTEGKVFVGSLISFVIVGGVIALTF